MYFPSIRPARSNFTLVLKTKYSTAVQSVRGSSDLDYWKCLWAAMSALESNNMSCMFCRFQQQASPPLWALLRASSSSARDEEPTHQAPLCSVHPSQTQSVRPSWPLLLRQQQPDMVNSTYCVIYSSLFCSTIVVFHSRLVNRRKH